MFKWLSKFKSKKQKSQVPIAHYYGRYMHKPITGRALSMIMGLSESDLRHLVEKEEVYLNDVGPLQPNGFVLRLESGAYEIKIPSQNKVWRFFIA